MKITVALKRKGEFWIFTWWHVCHDFEDFCPYSSDLLIRWFRILVGGGSIKRMLWWETAWSGNSCGVFSLLIWISPPLPVSVKIFIMPPSVCLLQSKHKSIKDNIMLTPFPSWLDRVNEKRNYLRDNRLQLKFFFSLYFTARWDQGALIDPTTIFNNGLCRWWLFTFTLDVEIKIVFCFSHHFSSVQGFFF